MNMYGAGEVMEVSGEFHAPTALFLGEELPVPTE
jgi:hypothetical protein